VRTDRLPCLLHRKTASRLSMIQRKKSPVGAAVLFGIFLASSLGLHRRLVCAATFIRSSWSVPSEPCLCATDRYAKPNLRHSQLSSCL